MFLRSVRRSVCRRRHQQTMGVVLRGTESLLTRCWREMDSNFQYADAVNLFVGPITMSPSNKGRSVGSVANRRSYLTRSNRPGPRRQPALRRS